jgi:rhodanese-related sulfurtransferase
MKRYLLTMFLPFLFAGCSAEPSFKSVGVEEFSAIAEKENTIVVDVRRADEWAEGHLESATCNIDALQEDFTDKANTILPKDKTIAIYCRSGRRSKAAATQLAEQGFDVVELDGGIISWQKSGKGVVK